MSKIQDFITGVDKYPDELSTSTEDFKDVVNNVNASFTKLKAKAFDSGVILRKRIERVKAALDKAKGKEAASETISVSASIITTLSSKNVCEDVSGIQTTLKGLLEIDEAVREKFFPSAIETADAYIDLLENIGTEVKLDAFDFIDYFENDERFDRLKKVFDTLDLDSLLTFCKEETKSGKTTHKSTPYLSGDKVMYLDVDKSDIEPKAELTNELRRQRKLLFKVMSVSDKKRKFEKNEAFPILTYDECVELLGYIDSYSTHYKYEIEEGAVKELQSRSDDKSLKLFVKGITHTNLSSRTRGLAWLPSKSYNWSVHPYMDLGVVTADVIRATLVVIERSLKQYK